MSSNKSKDKDSRPLVPPKHHSFHDTLHMFAHKHKNDLPIIISILQGFQDIIAVSPLSFLTPAFVVLTQLISTISDTDGNYHDGRTLASNVSEYINTIQAYADCSDDNSLRALQQEDTMRYLRSLKQAHENAAKVAGQKPLTAFLHAFENKAGLKKISKEVESLNIEFLLKTALAISKKLDELHADRLKEETRPNHEPNPPISPTPLTSKDHPQHSRVSPYETSFNPVARMANPPICGFAKHPNMNTPDQRRPRPPNLMSMPVPEVNRRAHIRMPEPELHHLPPRYPHCPH